LVRGFLTVVILLTQFVGAPSAHAQADPCVAAAASGRLRELGGALEQTIPIEGVAGQPLLCLVKLAREGVYHGFIANVANVSEFRAAKAAAIAQLRGQGQDPCNVVQWNYWSDARQTGYGPSDQFGAGGACLARVIAGDAGAQDLIPMVDQALARAVQVTHEDLGWIADVPFYILVYTDEQAAVAGYQRHVPEPPERAAEFARAGRSQAVNRWGSDVVYSNAVLLSLPNPARRVQALITQEVVQAYTVFALFSTFGTSVPRWFSRGVSQYQRQRRSADNQFGGDLVTAARDGRLGQGPRLAGVITTSDGAAAEQATSVNRLYARASAAIAMLIDRIGIGGVWSITKDASVGTVDGFNASFAQRAGLTVASLDTTLDEWLRSRPSATASGPDGQAELVQTREGGTSELFLTVSGVPTSCPGVTSQGTISFGFGTILPADGSIAIERPATVVGTSVRVTGQYGGKLDLQLVMNSDVPDCTRTWTFAAP
jgi:hypothetical protein